MYRDIGYRQVHRNPNDLLMTLLLLGSAGAILWYMKQQGLLPDVFPGTGTPGRQPSEKRCFDIKPGNTSLTLQVTPWNPPKQLDAPISFFGQLTVPGISNLSGQVVEFWDNKKCMHFDAAITNEQGFYAIPRPLQPDELDGYSVFAFYSGGLVQGELIGLDKAITGVIQVKPGA